MLKKVDEIIVAGTKHYKITHPAQIEELVKDLTAFFQFYHKKT